MCLKINAWFYKRQESLPQPEITAQRTSCLSRIWKCFAYAMERLRTAFASLLCCWRSLRRPELDSTPETEFPPKPYRIKKPSRHKPPSSPLCKKSGLPGFPSGTSLPGFPSRASQLHSVTAGSPLSSAVNSPRNLAITSVMSTLTSPPPGLTLDSSQEDARKFQIQLDALSTQSPLVTLPPPPVSTHSSSSATLSSAPSSSLSLDSVTASPTCSPLPPASKPSSSLDPALDILKEEARKLHVELVLSLEQEKRRWNEINGIKKEIEVLHEKEQDLEETLRQVKKEQTERISLSQDTTGVRAKIEAIEKQKLDVTCAKQAAGRDYESSCRHAKDFGTWTVGTVRRKYHEKLREIERLGESLSDILF